MLTYDAIGNPISYYNGISYAFTWKGRQLTGATKGSTNISFAYDEAGLRTRKTVNGTITRYVYEGTLLIAEYTNAKATVYIYDANGSPIGFKSRTSTYAEDVWDVYWYEKNLQGDIVAIYNTAGTKLIGYHYNAWGAATVTYSNGGASTTAVNNNLKYRGYYYDSDLGMYYLQSRYYDPVVCRFINADGYVSTGQGILGCNMFAYCGNNPTNRVDSTGQFWKELLDAFTKTIQQASGYFAVAAGVSQVDTPALGPADVVSGVLLLGGVLVCAGIATYTAITAPATSISIPKTEENTEAILITSPSSTVIYRYGGTNPGNLTPKSKDKYSGLSFSTVPMPGAAVTTIEAINATGVVYAVQDSPTHVSVRPVGATMEDWINAGSGSIWTQAVKSVVSKWDGGY